jgi:transposase InsO family protein
MPRLGTRKLHHLLQQNRPDGLGPIGRDWLFKFLKQHGLLVSRKKKYVRTTDSSQWTGRYPNLVQNLTPSRPEQIWVADITYLVTRKGYHYLHLLTDAYSKKIVGYQLSSDMTATSTLKALQVALNDRKYNLPIIHHSDRGLQYHSSIYTQTLTQAGIAISMTQDGSPYDNAIAERVNGILKQEYGLDETIEDITTLKQMVRQAIISYNNHRPHFSCSLLTPEQMHQQSELQIRKWSKVKNKSSVSLKIH